MNGPIISDEWPQGDPDEGFLQRPGRRCRVAVCLFCGIGGTCAGFESAECRTVLAIDNWQVALDVHAANFPDCEQVNMELGGDLQTAADFILSRVPIEHIENWHLHGSPPCQDLSAANPNGDRAEGMRLVLWFLELVQLMNPPSWSMEQVPRCRPHLPTWVPVQLLNAPDFGVPQTRERLVAGRGWIAARTHTKPVSMLDALPHLADYELRENVNKNIRQRSIDEPIRTLTHKLPGQVHLAIRGYSRTRPVLDRRGNHTGENVPHGDDDCNRPLDGLCWTVGAQPLLLLRANSGANAAARPRSLGGQSHALTSGGGLGPSLGTQPGLKFKRVRQLTPEEGLALMGFLPDFDLSAATTQRDKWQGIGNAVCPPVAAAIINGRLSELETLDGWL